jgi:hypothetical protein
LSPDVSHSCPGNREKHARLMRLTKDYCAYCRLTAKHERGTRPGRSAFTGKLSAAPEGIRGALLRLSSSGGRRRSGELRSMRSGDRAPRRGADHPLRRNVELVWTTHPSSLVGLRKQRDRRMRYRPFAACRTAAGLRAFRRDGAHATRVEQGAGLMTPSADRWLAALIATLEL